MSLLPYQKFTLETRISADEAKMRLADIVDQTYDLFDRKKPYRGEITKNQFSIRNNEILITPIRYFCLPVIEGTVKDKTIDFQIRLSIMAVFPLLSTPLFLILSMYFKHIILLLFFLIFYGTICITFSSQADKDKEFLIDLFTRL